MNTRQAKKIQCHPFDPHQKTSATTPYSDAQNAEASRVMRRSFERARKAHPSMPPMDLRMKWTPTRLHVWRGRWRPGLNAYRSQGGEA